jgi:hypothetical protein
MTFTTTTNEINEKLSHELNQELHEELYKNKVTKKKDVNGIIMILSCQKHKNTRLKEFCLSKTSYNNWEVIYVIGDLFLKNNYTLDGNTLYVRCEDSYLHLLKKLILAMKSVKELFNIIEGILRCGDDLIFNEDNLIKFTNSTKFDYYGQSSVGSSFKCNNKNMLKNLRNDPFMLMYYNQHQEDFNNPQHGLKNMTLLTLSKYTMRPHIYGAAGVIFYLSNKACDIAIRHMEQLNFNVLSYDVFTKSYPYTIEDCGISFIMYYNDIEFIDGQFFYDSNHVNNIARHTNKYK